MTVEAYQSLIDQICEHAGISNPKAMYEMMDVEVDECNFMLKHGKNCESVLIYADMGELPEKAKEAALLRLMETNLYMFGDWYNPVFSYNSETKHILMLCSIWLGEASGTGTLMFLEHLSKMVKEWRTNYFLDEKEAKSGSLSTGRSGSNSSLGRFSAQFGAIKAPQRK
jgi:hypothetical protein